MENQVAQPEGVEAQGWGTWNLLATECVCQHYLSTLQVEMPVQASLSQPQYSQLVNAEFGPIPNLCFTH